MYLPLLPAKEINAIFSSQEKIAIELNEPSMDRFISYYKRQWIRKEGPAKISVFGDETKTTSPAEGYNRHINEYCPKKGSFIWFCTSMRSQEFMKSSEFHAFVESGGLTAPKQNKQDRVGESFDFYKLWIIFQKVYILFRSAQIKYTQTI